MRLATSAHCSGDRGARVTLLPKAWQPAQSRCKFWRLEIAAGRCDSAEIEQSLAKVGKQIDRLTGISGA